MKALDETKDQSYVLYSMTQEQLMHTLFPLGNLKKTEVRKIADNNCFINASKPDSQDICFVPDGDYAKFLTHETGKEYKKGDFVDEQGNVLGRHEGIVHYTIGQRKGLGISFGKPMYVKKINMSDNIVVLGAEEELYSKSFYVDDFNWISGEAVNGEITCKVKVRYRQKEQPAKVYVISDRKVKIEFDTPQRAITPGQAAVLYDGDVVLGDGTIESVI